MNPHVTFFWCDEDGQDLVEYSLLLAFLALAAIAILSGVSGSVNALWTTITSSLTGVASYMGS
jgi:Flp pilus assembly pilin Flp